MIVKLNIYGEPDIHGIRSTIINNLSFLSEKLTKHILYFSEGAYLMPGSFKINSINDLKNNEYSFSYIYEWGLTNGCLNLHAQSVVNDKVNCFLEGKELVFDIVDVFKPSTADEL